MRPPCVRVVESACVAVQVREVCGGAECGASVDESVGFRRRAQRARCGNEVYAKADKSAVATVSKTKELKKRSWGVRQERMIKSVWKPSPVAHVSLFSTGNGETWGIPCDGP